MNAPIVKVLDEGGHRRAVLVAEGRPTVGRKPANACVRGPTGDTALRVTVAHRFNGGWANSCGPPARERPVTQNQGRSG